MSRHKESLWERIQSVYRSVLPYDWRPGQIWYRLKCFCWHRYTTIHPRTLPHHTWTDRCTLLPHAMFSVLTDFIENECSPGCVEWYGEYPHVVDVNGVETNVRDEMQAIYDWWHQKYLKEYPERTNALYEEAQRWHGFDWDSNWEEMSDGNYLYKPKYKSEEAKQKYKAAMDAQGALEAQAEAELKDAMHRIVNIARYMWT